MEDRTSTTTDAVGTKSPQLNAGTLALFMPPGCTSVTVRADAATGSPTVARYSKSVLAVGAQVTGDGSRLFDLGGDKPIPCFGTRELYFAVDAGTANWNWEFEIGGTIRTR